MKSCQCSATDTNAIHIHTNILDSKRKTIQWTLDISQPFSSCAHNRRPIPCPWSRDMERQLWVWPIYIPRSGHAGCKIMSYWTTFHQKSIIYIELGYTPNTQRVVFCSVVCRTQVLHRIENRHEWTNRTSYKVMKNPALSAVISHLVIHIIEKENKNINHECKLI